MTGAAPGERRARGLRVLRVIMLALDEAGGLVDRERLIRVALQYGARIGATRDEIEEVLRLSLASMFCEPSSVDGPTRTIRVTKSYTDVATAEADHAAGIISAESLAAVRAAFAPSVRS